MQCKRYASECKRNCKGKCAIENVYCPSNGTEGAWFTEKYCMNCLHCDPNPEGKKQCEILLASMCHYPTEPGYPLEWIYDSSGNPKCTNYVYWDWDESGDPDDPDNPNKPPDPPDPNQLELFPLLITEKDYDQRTLQLITA